MIPVTSRCPFPPQDLVIRTDSAKALADSLNEATLENFSYFNTLLRILATRCMMQAVYFCSGMDNDFHHYGLASPIYTHFTSPIRRSASLALTQQETLQCSQISIAVYVDYNNG